MKDHRSYALNLSGWKIKPEEKKKKRSAIPVELPIPRTERAIAEEKERALKKKKRNAKSRKILI